MPKSTRPVAANPEVQRATVPARTLTLSEPGIERAEDLSSKFGLTTSDEPEIDYEATLPGVASSAHSLPSSADPTFELKERYALGDFTGALELAETMLKSKPDHPVASSYANNARQVLVHMYSARLGSTAAVPSLVMAPEQLRWLNLDPKAGFLLGLVDGFSTIEEIIDMSTLAPLEVLKTLYDLSLQKVIVSK